ncbi:PREDICTED: major royal jelly protein 5-like [Cyphomyrmex costatus]|uniref:major royal jelly protein 5-like n=1 Tax=Cyphomyrmex costatus TaxID=456900 RepID=UPI0008521E24|nr:PREDICTED: major royal jelly protein 5-like [Cyphomyrmex costatus]
MRHSLLIVLILSMAIVSFGIKVNVIHQWKYIDYEWESQEQKEDAINSGTYNPYKNFLNGVDRANDGRVFVTVSKYLNTGVPATLATVTNKTGPGGPLLRPYPDWSWHNNSSMCDGIINVYKLHIRCNHIFVLDNGQIGSCQICKPKLLIFNLKNDTLVKTIYIPFTIVANQTDYGLLVKPVVYVPGKCERLLDEMIIFMADTGGYGLVVYDSSTERMCRVESDYMKPTDIYFSIAHTNFTYVGGIYSMTILEEQLFYAPVSGKEIYKIKIKTLLKCPNKKEANKQTQLVQKLSSQTVDITSAKYSIFYSDTMGLSILGTNVCKKSGENTVLLAQDKEKFQSVSSMTASSYWDKLICMSDRFQRLYTLNLKEINFRHFEMELSEILKEMDQSE